VIDGFRLALATQASGGVASDTLRLHGYSGRLALRWRNRYHDGTVNSHLVQHKALEADSWATLEDITSDATGAKEWTEWTWSPMIRLYADIASGATLSGVLEVRPFAPLDWDRHQLCSDGDIRALDPEVVDPDRGDPSGALWARQAATRQIYEDLQAAGLDPLLVYGNGHKQNPKVPGLTQVAACLSLWRFYDVEGRGIRETEDRASLWKRRASEEWGRAMKGKGLWYDVDRNLDFNPSVERRGAEDWITT